jgi:hypothetical protein
MPDDIQPELIATLRDDAGTGCPGLAVKSRVVSQLRQ